jgi:acetyltransferase-like isoleucine patch superfamily enzyme
MKIPKNIVYISLRKLLSSLYYKFKYRKNNLFIEYPSLIKNTTFGNNIKLYNNTIVQSSIDDFTYMGNETQILNSTIGKFCSIGADCKIGLSKHPSETFVSTHPIFYSKLKQAGVTFADKNYFQEDQSVIIGNDVWIGVNSIITGSLIIGDGAIIAAGAVVTKDVLPYSIVGGIPAKHIKFRFSQIEMEQLLKDKWWLKDEEYLRKNFKKFHNISDYLTENK